MEDDGSLDCLNEVDMFCLHYALLPRINQALEGFVESWDNHPVSTCQNLTPNQLFIQGALRQNMTPHCLCLVYLMQGFQHHVV